MTDWLSTAVSRRQLSISAEKPVRIALAGLIFPVAATALSGWPWICTSH